MVVQSNSNFLLLGAIIERQTGRGFTSVVEAELFRPLDWRVLDMKSAALPSRRLAIRTLPPPAPLAGLQLGTNPSQATRASPVARWVAATRPPTT